MALEEPVRRKNRLLKLSVLNLLLLCLLAGVEYFGDQRLWPVALLVFLPQQPVAIPTFALLLFCTWKKRPKDFAFNLIAALFVIFYFLGFNIPFQRYETRAATSAPTLRVMTYNIRYGSLGISKVAELIKTENPDIICLQEVIDKAGWPDPFPTLKKALPEYSVAHDGQFTTRSRWPIREQKFHRLAAHSDFGVLETRLIVRGKTLTIFNTHLSNLIERQVLAWPHQIQTRTKLREKQFELLHQLTAQEHSYLVAGDFNTPPRGFQNHALDLGSDVWKASGWGFGNTFSASLPAVRIDYLWASKDLRPLSSRVLASRASDHRALTAQLGLE